MARPSNDDKLIKENPKATPYQLLEMGLSQKKYEDLTSKIEDPKPAQKTIQPEVKQVQPRIQPKKVTLSAANGGEMAYLVNMTNGIKVRMTRSAAIKMASKNPNKFQVQ